MSNTIVQYIPTWLPVWLPGVSTKRKIRCLRTLLDKVMNNASQLTQIRRVSNQQKIFWALSLLFQAEGSAGSCYISSLLDDYESMGIRDLQLERVINAQCILTFAGKSTSLDFSK